MKFCQHAHICVVGTTTDFVLNISSEYDDYWVKTG